MAVFDGVEAIDFSDEPFSDRTAKHVKWMGRNGKKGVAAARAESDEDQQRSLVRPFARGSH